VGTIAGRVGMAGAVGADVAGVVCERVVGAAGVVGAEMERSGVITTAAPARLSHETEFTGHRCTKISCIPLIGHPRRFNSNRICFTVRRDAIAVSYRVARRDGCSQRRRGGGERFAV